MIVCSLTLYQQGREGGGIIQGAQIFQGQDIVWFSYERSSIFLCKYFVYGRSVSKSIRNFPVELLLEGRTVYVFGSL